MNVSIVMPDMGENIDHGIVTRVAVAAGDQVEVGQPLIEVESDKVILEVPAEHSGVVKDISIKEGDDIRPGEQFAVIQEQSTDSRANERPEIILPPRQADTPEPEAATAPQQPRSEPSRSGHVYAGPSAHRLARELGVPLAQVPGSEARGRISVNDVKAFIRTRQVRATPFKKRSLPDFSSVSSIGREPLSAIAQTTAHSLTRTWNGVPHAWLQVLADITQLESLRKHQDSLNAADQKPGLTVYLLKLLALSLKTFPRFNACYDENTEELILKKEIHLGLAVDSPSGLLVPVIRNADRLSLRQLEEQFNRLTASARASQLGPAQSGGSGMTLRPLGDLGIDSHFPLINWPEVAILGTGTITRETFRQEDHTPPRAVIPLVLGFDLRVINDADAARFLNHLKNLLENPFLAAMQ